MKIIKINIIKLFTYTMAIMLILLSLGLSGKTLAALPETEVFAQPQNAQPVIQPAPPETEVFEEDLIEDHPAAQDSDPVIMFDIDEVGMPEIPVEDLIFMQWEKEGYPDDIGGHFYDSNTNSFGILVVNPSQQRIDELLEMFENRVIIIPCRFSFNELKQVQNEITELMFSNPNSGIYGSGIGWTSSNTGVHGFGDSGKEFRVTVSVDESVFDHYYAGFSSRYGDRVIVEAGYEAINEDTGGGIIMEGGSSAAINLSIIPVEITGTFGSNFGNGNAGGNHIWLWVIISIALLCSLALLIRFRLSPTPAKQTVNGGVDANNAALTDKQIISSIKDSGCEPGDELFLEIMKQVDDSKK